MTWINRNWLMLGIIKGLVVTIKHFFKIGNRPVVTVQYPYERMEIAQRFRGLHSVDKNKCIGCGICEMNCPNNSIQIVRHNKGWYPQVKIGQCMFCGLCVDTCPMDAMQMTGEYELAQRGRDTLVYDPDRLLVTE
ncbi:MAG: F(420)H(2) dehydrogenase subunit I [Candidatus Argoarchaeum ethanivorans]|uniref:F(420)H(2) dehydrogenase subunit I n=1 Tax=Candidatus Argoarchaeum ethanivorans TaxID=2608793 RepID=A0A811T5V7_9EURY|nr:MAG: F(420)H(2) dehydrogenase subunit I [Candidatus Argoarchaeum ethanivorans]